MANDKFTSFVAVGYSNCVGIQTFHNIIKIQEEVTCGEIEERLQSV